MDNSENIEIIWNQFSSGLRSFILSKVKNDVDSDDILQNTFLKIHYNINSLNDRSKIKPWIYRITRNLIIDHFRENHQNKKIKELKSGLTPSSSSGKYMDIAVNDMIKMMNELSPEYCEALCVIEIEGKSQKEYAQMKGLSYSGAKSRVQRARMMLKDMLMKCCHYQFDRYGTVFDIQPNCCCCGDH